MNAGSSCPQLNAVTPFGTPLGGTSFRASAFCGSSFYGSSFFGGKLAGILFAAGTFLIGLHLGELPAHANSGDCVTLDCKNDVYRSKNQELVLNRFGYRRSASLPSAYGQNVRRVSSRGFSELRGYHLEDETQSPEDRLLAPQPAEEVEANYDDGASPAERFNHYVQGASETLLGGLALVVQQWFGEETAYADEEDGGDGDTVGGVEIEDPSYSSSRDALVHF